MIAVCNFRLVSQFSLTLSLGHLFTEMYDTTKRWPSVKRTLYQCDPEVKATAYSTLVRPSLEYATVVWDQHQQYLINSIEMVQRRAARWVKQEYSMTTSVTAILNNLEWNLLSKRRQFSRLTYFLSFYTKTHLLSEFHNIICPPH